MSKIVLVETVSTFRHVYAVRLKDNEPVEYALDDVVMNVNDNKISEVTQSHIAEDIFSHRVVTEKEYLEMFDRDNAYLSEWPTEKKLEFIYQRETEIDWGPDVGKEILEPYER
jgi:hypothetical protein